MSSTDHELSNLNKKLKNSHAYFVLGIFTVIFSISLSIEKAPFGEAINSTPVAVNDGDNSGGPCIDNDGDGFAGSGGNCGSLDFNDSDKFLFPNAPEWCDGKDNNNDGRTDYLNIPGDFCSAKDCYANICKAIITWKGLGPADYPTLNKFDLILTNGQNASKGENVNGKFITHRSIVEAGNYSGPYFDWATINNHEDWYVHNAGQRLQNVSYPFLWLMDMGKQAYRDFMVNLVGDIVVYSGLDGYFFDNFVDLDRHASYVSGNYNGFNVRTIYASNAVFDDYMRDVAYRMKRAMGNRLILANNHGEYYQEYYDGYMAENWIHNSNVDGWPAGWYPESKWLEDIESARDQANRNKILFLQCNNSVLNPTVYNFCLASYLMAKEQGIHTYFSFSYGETNPEYNTLLDIDLGAPTQSYQKIHNDGLYQRVFAKGKVLVNPTDNKTFTDIDLGGTYRDPQGNVGTKVTLASHRAIILFSVDTPPPAVCGNGIRETGEQCDGSDLNGLTCQSWGFNGGTLTCSASCAYNTSQCISNTPAICGNSIIDPGEQCDGTNLGSQSCSTLGFSGGSLSCNTSCQLVTGLCTGGSGGSLGGDQGGLSGSGDGDTSTSTPDLPADEEEQQPLVPTDQTRGRLMSLLGRRGAAVYWVGSDGKKYVFPDEKTYLSWFNDFDDVDYVTLSELDDYPDGGAVTHRPGAYLITHSDTARVYAVSQGGVLHWIPSEQAAINLYGLKWASRVRDVIPGFFSTSYTVGEPLSNIYPDGALIQKGPDIYIIYEGKKRRFTSMEAFFANGLNTNNIILVNNVDIFENGTDISGYQDFIARLKVGVAN